MCILEGLTWSTFKDAKREILLFLITFSDASRDFQGEKRNFNKNSVFPLENPTSQALKLIENLSFHGS